ncbi:hypothetical protein KP509_12G035800 [Ceratopteris richardii]|uniref:Transmembrane protein n=1 Tax=Ceratopteris richardii TaxID=49495 RepID=A0A8T2TKL2_CERRI|nr:hypothetical protein KP509_12G035800 [Ceratopteris richardii]
MGYVSGICESWIKFQALHFASYIVLGLGYVMNLTYIPYHGLTMHFGLQVLFIRVEHNCVSTYNFGLRGCYDIGLFYSKNGATTLALENVYEDCIWVGFSSLDFVWICCDLDVRT